MTQAASRVRVVHVAGARPNFMKIAPLLREARRAVDWDNVLVHTGQHYDEGMSDAFFRDLGIPPPDHRLGAGSGTHAEQTARVLVAMERLIEDLRPSVVIVVGDVNSTLAAALAASKLVVPVAHVEAGLRSGDRAMPEEINRIVTDQLSDFCFTPSRDAGANLLREGIPEDRIHFAGNIMVDSLLAALPEARQRDIAHLGTGSGPYVLATLHRPSNVDDRAQLEEILWALRTVAERMPVILPLHPRTRGRIEEFGLALGAILTIPPAGYLDMLRLQDGAAVVITDSGGLQEETTVLGVPCLTLRTTTERPVTVTEGTNRLLPERRRDTILAAVDEALATPRKPGAPEGWDGQAAARIVSVLDRALAGSATRRE